jgi:hypothetical protein
MIGAWFRRQPQKSKYGLSPNGLWKPGGDYDFPKVKTAYRRNADISRVLPRETQSVDIAFFKELTEGWYGLTNQG